MSSMSSTPPPRRIPFGLLLIIALAATSAFAGYKAFAYRVRAHSLRDELRVWRDEAPFADPHGRPVAGHELGAVERFIYSDFTAVRQPTPADLQLDAMEDVAFLREVLGRIFPDGRETRSAEAQCIEILKFVSTHHRLERNAGTATKIIHDGHAICGGLATAYEGLARLAGIPTRKVGLMGLRLTAGHSLCESHYDGGWHLFDPTYGIFLHSDAACPGAGHVLSLHERLHSLTPATMMKVAERPWNGYAAAVRSFPVTPVEPTYLADMYGCGLDALYDEYMRTAFPALHDVDSISSSPVLADLTTTSELRLGQVDGSVRDLDILASQRLYVGSSSLGTCQPYTCHTIMVQAAGPCVVDIEYTATEADSPSLFFLPLMAMHLREKEESANVRRFRVAVQGRLGVATIFCPYGHIFWVDSLVIRKVDAP
jgi:hypothetical protein